MKSFLQISDTTPVGRFSKEINYLRWLHESGLGEIQDYKIVGNDIELLISDQHP
ncbi:MAG: hypothetical protein ACTSYJ_02100 [Candidatus Thorarchaeota archaeon]